ncbi:hypothetical protein TRFO_06735 [Tritrichomonas foetus]|uniref:Uncharacterized protein n=1 Tax=Tritrichomonas foetus TaxID=1144522 RepID=A0A1J4JYC9_9EUKA|nr:hypothetical protein TRFO_06735 [Tritrichomonas foetus]|eukprot:OHT03472.1 hypothetical protein TRFO_06735 [Tritrichomonas foetus]
MTTFNDIYSKSLDFFGNIFKTSYPEIEEFQPTDIAMWIKLVNKFPHMPYLFLIECVCACYFIRSFVKIHKPIFSLLFTLFVVSLTDNLSSIMRNRKLAVFENYLIAPFTLFFWILYNYFPFDLIYKLSKCISMLIFMLSGFVIGHNLTRGIDEAINLYPTSAVMVILTGILYGSCRHISIYVFARSTHQESRSAGPVIFGTTLGALSYYYFTDLGHISYNFWFDKEEMRFVVITSLTFIGIVHFILPDWVFAKVFSGVGKVIAYFVPYYGSTWIPYRRTPVQAPAQKVKTE